MPKLTSDRVPSYRLHKQSGQAIVTLNGADVLLGKHSTAASKAEYNRRIGEWLAAGRQRPESKADLSITELIARYRVHCEAYYRRPDGSPTGEAENIKKAVRPLRLLYGSTPAADFSPLKLKAVREAMIDPKMIDPNATGAGWCRNLISHQCGKIRQMFKWAVENELVPASVHHGLVAVAGLKHGRCEARESNPVMPIDDSIVEGTLPFLSSVVSSMVQVQRLTGTRPSEVCAMTTGEIDRSGPVWTYRPTQHKTRHHGRQRVVAIGPKAQAVLLSFLKPLNPTACIFSPADSMAEMRDRRQSERKTPLSCGNRAGTNKKRSPNREPGERYTSDSYRRAVERACDQAFPVPLDLEAKEKAAWIQSHRWAPNRLRHSAGTEIRKRFGLEGAQVLLGHSSADVTQIYAERDQAAASRIAAAVG